MTVFTIAHPSTSIYCKTSTNIAPQKTIPFSTLCSTLLFRHTNSPSPPTSSLRMLAPHSQTPIMPQTSMRTDLLQTLQILTKLAVHSVGQDLRVLAIHDIALSVEEPGRNFVLGGVLDDGDNTLEFFGRDLTSSITQTLVAEGAGRGKANAYRLFKSTSAFLQTKLE